MDEMDLHSVYLMIKKILVTKGNPTLMPKGATDEKLNDQLKKTVQPTYTPTRGGLTASYPCYHPQGLVVF